jgi:predicted DCC family thiol-disulfide oxidoreductase YuxK
LYLGVNVDFTLCFIDQGLKYNPFTDIPSMNHIASLTLYFDGQCPLCRAEMIYLSAKDNEHKLHFVDINQEGALNALGGVSCEVAMANIHAVTQNNEMLIGVEAFRVAYGLVGLKVLSKILGIKFLRPLYTYGYGVFARNRYFLSRLLGTIALQIVRRLTGKSEITRPLNQASK